MNNKILMPKELTTENGAKGLLSGEFHTTYKVECEDCAGSGLFDEYEECTECYGSGKHEQKITIDWITIKEIYKMAVDHLGEES